ncbi:MAG: putative zinc-binding protein [bacterium]
MTDEKCCDSNKTDNSCCCGNGVRLVFPCSGAADVGAIADQVGRKMTREGLGKMYCLAGLGGHVSGIVETTKAADEVITINGCPIACATKTIEHIGITPKSFEVTSMGFKKYETQVTEEAINKVYAEIKSALS